MVCSSMYHQGERVMKILIQSKYNLLTSGKTYVLTPNNYPTILPGFFCRNASQPLALLVSGMTLDSWKK